MLDLDKIKATFMKGGYYRVDLSDKLSILALNTNSFSIKNE